jgi:glycosyltransferase involved in cell wall biosynthesis
VAFFTDSFHEVNGVALTSREFAAFAQRHALPFLSVHAGPEHRVFSRGSVTTVEFKRGKPRWNLESDLSIDIRLWRHRKRLAAAMSQFRPDLVHITGPGDAGILGFWLAHDFKIPLVASWHTNLHEFGARRLNAFLRWLPASVRTASANWAERAALDRCVWFYRFSKLIFAPNPELVDLLGSRTGRPAFLMTRGVDTTLFSPRKRDRPDKDFVLGYVGRLSPEKDVRMLAAVERRLLEAGAQNVRFLIVGGGSERAWLQRTMHRADLPGVRRGEDLAQAYASMDVLLFPSATDTFGNVVLEAMASGVPSIVTSHGGPKFLVANGVNGYHANNADEFASRALELSRAPELLLGMRKEARKNAERFTWDEVFGRVYSCYEACFPDAAGGGGSPPDLEWDAAPLEARVPQLTY